MWRGSVRLSLSVSAPFVWRCLNSRTITPFPHLAHRTGQADFPHPALGQDVTLSPTDHHAPSGLSAPDLVSGRGMKVDSLHPPAFSPCTCCVTTDATAPPCNYQAHDKPGCKSLLESSLPNPTTCGLTYTLATWSHAMPLNRQSVHESFRPYA